MKVLILVQMIIIAYFVIKKLKESQLKKKVRRLMNESIESYKKKYSRSYNEIYELKKKYESEQQYSGHMGISGRDAYSREENIRQDKKVKELREELRKKVERSNFKYVLREIFYNAGDDEKLYLTMLNLQSGYYSGTEVTVLDDLCIGFKTVPADRMVNEYIEER